MAIIQYTCNTCNRIIDIPQNKYGLEIIQKCIITEGCHGKLVYTARKIDYIREKFPDKVIGLDDYIPRKILYNHKQSIQLKEWRIIHNLGVYPKINVYINVPKVITNLEEIDLNDESALFDLVESTPDNIEIISINEIILYFDENESGIAQLHSINSSKEVIPDIKLESDVFFQVSNKSELIIGLLNTFVDINNTITIGYTAPNGNHHEVEYIVDSTQSITSPWVDYKSIYYDEQVYNIKNIDISNSEIIPGSSFHIVDINGLQVKSNELLLLLSNTPYETVDKVFDKIINLYDVTLDNHINNTLINDQYFIKNNKIIGIFPYIKRV